MPDRRWRLVTRIGSDRWVELPWDRPLEEWPPEGFVEVARGTHRHVVKFVEVGGELYALKELPQRTAEREYRLLRAMADSGLPVVEALGVVLREGIDDVLITRYLDYSLPYRHLFLNRWGTLTDAGDLSNRLLDALALLLVRLHLAGFYWGDCSLNNTLLKRDAGALAAYVVDLETGEQYETLTDGQRRTDLEITELNVAGGLLDVAAELDLPMGQDPVDLARSLTQRYENLWAELTSDVRIHADERYKIDARIRRLNELGFDVDEVEVISSADGDTLQLRTVVTEQGHHRRQLSGLTGVIAQENQARTILNDLASYRSWLEHTLGRQVPQSVAAYKWLSEVFEPTVAAIPDELRGKLEPPEVYVEVLRHKWYLSEQRGEDVGMEEATRSYIADVLPSAPDEKLIVPDPDEIERGWIGYG